jgi:hypothetical protein
MPPANEIIKKLDLKPLPGSPWLARPTRSSSCGRRCLIACRHHCRWNGTRLGSHDPDHLDRRNTHPGMVQSTAQLDSDGCSVAARRVPIRDQRRRLPTAADSMFEVV